MNDEVLHSKTNNFWPFFANKSMEFLLDVSTGEFLTAQGNAEYIDKLLQNFSPSEVLIQKTIKMI
jgi:DNA mismatch repair protein MutS